MAPRRCKNFKSINLQTHITDEVHGHFLRNCSQVNVTKHLKSILVQVMAWWRYLLKCQLVCMYLLTNQGALKISTLYENHIFEYMGEIFCMEFQIYPWSYPTHILRDVYFISRWKFTWWLHLMDIFSTLLALCAGNPPVTSVFLSQRPVTRSFEVFFDMKQSRHQWFEMQWPSLWHQCNERALRF